MKKKKKKIRKRVLLPWVLIAVSVGLMAAAVYIGGFADWYVSHIYPVLTGTIGRSTGLIPTSLSEIGLYIFVFVLIIGILYVFLSIIHKNWNRYRTKKTVVVLSWTIAVLSFLYVINCGINYRATSFAVKSGIIPREYTTDELRNVCLWLTEQVQKTEQEVSRNEKGVLIFTTDTGKNAVRAMQNLGESYSQFKGYYPEPKKLLFPEFLSIQSLTGIYSPFTVEANYNNDMTPYNIPFTMCHELAHLKGFMQEQEANFIAWLACFKSDLPEFQYSGALSGWIYASNQLWKYDQSAYREMYAMLPGAARKDLQDNDTFWTKYEGTISEVSNQINDTYLKSNGQKQGVKSYDKMVDMLVVYVQDILSG